MLRKKKIAIVYSEDWVDSVDQFCITVEELNSGFANTRSVYSISKDMFKLNVDLERNDIDERNQLARESDFCFFLVSEDLEANLLSRFSAISESLQVHQANKHAPLIWIYTKYGTENNPEVKGFLTEIYNKFGQYTHIIRTTDELKYKVSRSLESNNASQLASYVQDDDDNTIMMINGVAISQLKEISFFANNEEYSKKFNEIGVLKAEIKILVERLIFEPYNADLLNRKKVLILRIEDLKDERRQIEAGWIAFATETTKATTPISERIIATNSYLERGDLNGALKALNYSENRYKLSEVKESESIPKSDCAKPMHFVESDNPLNLVRELLLANDLLLADTENPERYEEILRNYEAVSNVERNLKNNCIEHRLEAANFCYLHKLYDTALKLFEECLPLVSDEAEKIRISIRIVDVLGSLGEVKTSFKLFRKVYRAFNKTFLNVTQRISEGRLKEISNDQIIQYAEIASEMADLIYQYHYYGKTESIDLLETVAFLYYHLNEFARDESGPFFFEEAATFKKMIEIASDNGSWFYSKDISDYIGRIWALAILDAAASISDKWQSVIAFAHFTQASLPFSTLKSRENLDLSKLEETLSHVNKAIEIYDYLSKKDYLLHEIQLAKSMEQKSFLYGIPFQRDGIFNKSDPPLSPEQREIWIKEFHENTNKADQKFAELVSVAPRAFEVDQLRFLERYISYVNHTFYDTFEQFDSSHANLVNQMESCYKGLSKGTKKQNYDLCDRVLSNLIISYSYENKKKANEFRRKKRELFFLGRQKTIDEERKYEILHFCSVAAFILLLIGLAFYIQFSGLDEQFLDWLENILIENGLI